MTNPDERGIGGGTSSSDSPSYRREQHIDSLWRASNRIRNPAVVVAAQTQAYRPDLPPPIVVNATGMVVPERTQGALSSELASEKAKQIEPHQQHDDARVAPSGTTEIAPKSELDQQHIPIIAAAAATREQHINNQHDQISPPVPRVADGAIFFSHNTTSTSEIILVPEKYDVLFGRGKTHRKNPGNVRMQLLADIHREAYTTTADRDDKTYITRIIVSIIKSSGRNSGRFLKFDVKRNCWSEVSDEVARMKVGHALRDGRGRAVGPIHPKVLQEILPLLSDTFKEAALRLGSSEFDDLSQQPR